jgi:cysteine sulfinate desulfinase/cysteine desulfurase-like protein
MKSIYLDYAAATPMDPKVLDSMKPYFSDKFYNPSATYLASKAVKQDLNESRRSYCPLAWAQSRQKFTLRPERQKLTTWQ